MFIEPYFGWLLAGVTWTLLVAGAAWIIALAIGCAVGVLSTLPSRIRRAIAYGLCGCVPQHPPAAATVPLVLRAARAATCRLRTMGQARPADARILVLRRRARLLHAARIAEQVRAGIESIGVGQRMAAAAMGFTTAQTYRYILLPVAARNVLPPLTSEALNIIKNSSLALTIGVLELTGQSRQIEAATFQGSRP